MTLTDDGLLPGILSINLSDFDFKGLARPLWSLDDQMGAVNAASLNGEPGVFGRALFIEPLSAPLTRER